MLEKHCAHKAPIWGVEKICFGGYDKWVFGTFVNCEICNLSLLLGGDHQQKLHSNFAKDLGIGWSTTKGSMESASREMGHFSVGGAFFTGKIVQRVWSFLLQHFPSYKLVLVLGGSSQDL